MKTILFYLIAILSIHGHSQTIYVNHAATGANNGSSWADAFTTVDVALQNVTAGSTEIRVAQGVYKPSIIGLANSRKATFTIPAGTQIYGGFNGTETTLAQRNPKVNITTLNGDLNGDDNSSIVYSNGSRFDNSYHVVSLMGNSAFIKIDGFTISGGNANGSLNYTLGINSFDDTRAGAIYVCTKNLSTINCEVVNCVLEKNTGQDVGVYASVSVQTNHSITVNFDRCIIRNNQSSGGFGNLFFLGFKNATNNRVTQNVVSNCLFHNNVSNYASGGQGASCISTYQDATAGGAFTTVYATITNCTFVNNTGPNGKVLSLLHSSNTKLANSILYNNGSTTPIYIYPTTSDLPTGNNNIIQGGQLSGSNVNPLFVSTTDFQLSSTSTAINTGNNATSTGVGTVDLLGNPRIVNTTVDIGCYEYDAAMGINENIIQNFSIYPNPSNGIVTVNCAEKIENITIYSLDGSLLKTTPISEIDISDLPNELYLIQIKTTDGKFGIQKLVKK